MHHASPKPNIFYMSNNLVPSVWPSSTIICLLTINKHVCHAGGLCNTVAAISLPIQ